MNVVKKKKNKKYRERRIESAQGIVMERVDFRIK